MELQAYAMAVKQRKGTEQGNADFMFRLEKLAGGNIAIRQTK